MPAGKLTCSVQWAGAPVASGRCPAGTRPGSSRCPAGDRPGSLRRPAGSRAVHWTMCPLKSAPQGSRKDFFMRIDPPKSWGARPDTVRSPHGTRKVPCGPFTGSLRPNGQIKTPGELGAADSAPRRPYGFKNCPGARRIFTVAGRTPAENSQNVCFYSPYGPRSVYVKAPLNKNCVQGNQGSILWSFLSQSNRLIDPPAREWDSYQLIVTWGHTEGLSKGVVVEFELKCKGRGVDPRHCIYVLWQGIILHLPVIPIRREMGTW